MDREEAEEGQEEGEGEDERKITQKRWLYNLYMVAVYMFSLPFLPW